MIYLFDFIVYGFLLTASLGLLTSWVDRKLTARFQYRVGPPFSQPFIDIIKLLGKETLVPVGASKATFLAAPVLGLASVIVVSTLLWVNNQARGVGFLGDLIVVVYLLMIPSISIMMGGFASRNPLASVGASREMKLILGYELPFLLTIFVVIIKNGFSLKLGDILSFQLEHAATIHSASGIIAFIVAVLCVQAKLGLVPFDIAEAEAEITSGPLIEYSGTPLAIYRLMKNMLLFVLPFLLVILFMGGWNFKGMHLFYGVLKYLGVVVLITIIRNTNPRVRIDQAMRFFWGTLTGLAVIALLLALRGL